MIELVERVSLVLLKKEAFMENKCVSCNDGNIVLGKGYNGFRYLERYQEGQYRQVWDELVQLGPAVFEDRFYAEALAVARAMMRRVRVNIETLIAKLLQCGFVFGYDFRLQEQLAHSLDSAHERRR